MNSKTYFSVVLGIVLAKIVGFSRDIFFANFYGTGVTADVYFQIFSVASLIFTSIGGALSTRVIMNLNKEENRGGDRQKAYVSFFLKRTTMYILAATGLLYVGARPLARLLLPEITGANFELAVRLTYIMLPSFLFVVVAHVMTGILQNSRVFFIPSIVSLPYNIIIIASLFIPNVKIEQIGLATTVGWLLHIVIQLPDFYRKGYRFLYRGKERIEYKRGRIDYSIWWIFLSNLMFQLCFIIDKIFVSGEAGQAATINYASNLFTTVSSVFVVAMSSIVFPSISRNYEEGRLGFVRELIGYVISIMFAVFVPYLLVVTLFGEQLIGFLYERGEFTGESTILTALIFTIYCFSILGYLAQQLINKVLYLASRYDYTLIGTVVVLALKVICNSIFVPKYGTVAAAVTTTILLTLYAVMALIVLRKIIGKFFTKTLAANIGKVFAAGGAALIVYYVLYMIMPGVVTSREIVFVIPIAVCGVVYLGVAFVLGLHKQLFKNFSK